MINIEENMLNYIVGNQLKSGKKFEKRSVIIKEICPHLNVMMPAADINTSLRAAHFLGQICHESDLFSTLREYEDGSSYEWRASLGNIMKGDGPKYKGRGLIQLTGRSNYKKYGTLLGIDLINDPLLAEKSDIAVRIACAYWKQNKLNELADKDRLTLITKAINGGYNGLESRKFLVNRAKKCFGLT